MRREWERRRRKARGRNVYWIDQNSEWLQKAEKERRRRKERGKGIGLFD